MPICAKSQRIWNVLSCHCGLWSNLNQSAPCRRKLRTQVATSTICTCVSTTRSRPSWILANRKHTIAMVLLSILLLGVGMTRCVLLGTQPPRGITPDVIIVPSGQAQSAGRPQRQPWNGSEKSASWAILQSIRKAQKMVSQYHPPTYLLS